MGLTDGLSASSARCTVRCSRLSCPRTSGPPMRRTGRREGTSNHTSRKYRLRKQRRKRGETKKVLFGVGRNVAVEVVHNAPGDYFKPPLLVSQSCHGIIASTKMLVL